MLDHEDSSMRDIGSLLIRGIKKAAGKVSNGLKEGGKELHDTY